jgi:hypothetical protein
MVIRADVQKLKQTVSDIPGILAAYQQKNAACRQQNDHSFGQFERGDYPKNRQGTWMFWLGRCDVGMHRRTHYNIISPAANVIVAPR